MFIYRFSIHAVRVAVPPGSPASVRAELSWLLLGDDLYQLSALLAGNGILGGITQAVTAAERAYCIIGNTEHLTDFYITDAL